MQQRETVHARHRGREHDVEQNLRARAAFHAGRGAHGLRAHDGVEQAKGGFFLFGLDEPRNYVPDGHRLTFGS